MAIAHICKLDRLVREITFQLYSPAGSLEYTIMPGTVISLTVKEFENNGLALGLSQDSFTLKAFADSTRLDIYE